MSENATRSAVSGERSGAAPALACRLPRPFLRAPPFNGLVPSIGRKSTDFLSRRSGTGGAAQSLGLPERLKLHASPRLRVGARSHAGIVVFVVCARKIVCGLNIEPEARIDAEVAAQSD